jgi:hypothetical protein
MAAISYTRALNLKVVVLRIANATASVQFLLFCEERLESYLEKII